MSAFFQNTSSAIDSFYGIIAIVTNLTFLSAGPANSHYIQGNPGSYLPEQRGIKFLQHETGCARGCSEVPKFTVSCLHYHDYTCQLTGPRSVIGKMSLSVKQSLLGRLRTLLKRMHVG